MNNWTEEDLRTAYEDGCKFQNFEDLKNHLLQNQKFVIKLSDNELKIVTRQELDEMYESAAEFDGFCGFIVKGQLI